MLNNKKPPSYLLWRFFRFCIKLIQEADIHLYWALTGQLERDWRGVINSKVA